MARPRSPSRSHQPGGPLSVADVRFARRLQIMSLAWYYSTTSALDKQCSIVTIWHALGCDVTIEVTRVGVFPPGMGKQAPGARDGQTSDDSAFLGKETPHEVARARASRKR